MEDKQLSTQQSIELIAKMIENTRRNFNNRGGAMFLIWGGVTILTSIAVLLLVRFTGNNAYQWLWWAIPVMGTPASIWHVRRTKAGVSTYMDKVVWAVWLVTGSMCFLIPMASIAVVLSGGVVSYNILFVIALVVSGATAMTGLIIRYRPVTIGGFLGILLSFVIPQLRGDYQMYQVLMFAGIFTVAQIIPGIMLNISCRKDKSA